MTSSVPTSTGSTLTSTGCPRTCAGFPNTAAVSGREGGGAGGGKMHVMPPASPPQGEGVGITHFWFLSLPSPVLMKDRCKLFCRVAGNTAYYQLRDRVIDGTPCGPDTNDICVQGLCRVSIFSFFFLRVTAVLHGGIVHLVVGAPSLPGGNLRVCRRTVLGGCSYICPSLLRAEEI